MPNKNSAEIIDKGGDYLLAIKGNQGRLHGALKNVFNAKRLEEKSLDVFTTQDEKHGRIEDRHGLISLNTSEIEDLAFEWPGLKSIGYTLSFRKQIGKETTCSSRYYIGSSELTSEHFLNATRDHCSIENRLHWKLDVGMGEDQCRIRRENVVGKLASVHHIALNLLKSTTSFKAGIKRKLHKANRCDIYRDKRSELVKKSKLNTILQK